MSSLLCDYSAYQLHPVQAATLILHTLHAAQPDVTCNRARHDVDSHTSHTREGVFSLRSSPD